MDRYLRDEADPILHKAANSVKRKIEDLCDRLEARLKATTDKMMDRITEDYMNVFSGQDSAQNSVAMQAARGEVSFILNQIDDRIQHVVRDHTGASPDGSPAAIKPEYNPKPIQESTQDG